MSCCIVKLVNYSLKRGLCVEATLGYQMLGFLFGHWGGFEKTYQCGMIAMRMQARFTGCFDGLTSAYAYFFNYHICHLLSDCLDPLLSCYELSMENGDPTGTKSWVLLCAYIIIRHDPHVSIEFPNRGPHQQLSLHLLLFRFGSAACTNFQRH